MKMKRFISAIAALTMSVSCFAGLAITANAATEQYSEDFEGDAALTTWTSRSNYIVSSGGNAPTIETEDTNKYFKWTSGSGNGRGAYTTLPGGPFAATNQKISFDFKYNSSPGDSSNGKQGFHILDSTGKIIFYLHIGYSLQGLDINGTPIYVSVNKSTVPTVWYTIDAQLNYANHTIAYSVYPKEDTSSKETGTVDFSDDTAANIGRLGYYQQGGGSCDYRLDNLVISSLITPTIDIADEDLTQEVAAGTKDVAVDIADSSSVSVTSDNTDVITVSEYDSTNKKITLTYVANGVANVTVSATSADGITVTKTIAVVAGSVAKHDITVKYVLADDYTTEIAAADTTTFAQKAEGSAISLSEITALVTEKIYKNASDEVVAKASATKEYVYAGLDPATITADDDYTVTDDATIYIKYTPYTLWSYTITDSINHSVIQTGTGFVGDEDKFNYAYPKYLTNEAGKVIAVSDSSTYTGSVTPEESGSKEIAYTAYEGDAWFVDVNSGSSIGKTDYGSGNLSGGSGRRTIETDSYEAITVPQDGKYEIEIGGSMNRKDKAYNITVYQNTADTSIFSAESEANTIDAGVSKVDKTTEDVSLYAGDKLLVKSNADSNTVFDYLLIKRTGDLEPVVSEITEVETPIALTSVTGEVAAPEFATIEAFVAKYASTKQLKLTVTDPADNVYPVVTINDIEYALTEDDVTAITANHVSTFYFEFAAETAEKLKEFGEITISYGEDEAKVNKTYDFNPTVEP